MAPERYEARYPPTVVLTARTEQLAAFDDQIVTKRMRMPRVVCGGCILWTARAERQGLCDDTWIGQKMSCLELVR